MWGVIGASILSGLGFIFIGCSWLIGRYTRSNEERCKEEAVAKVIEIKEETNRDMEGYVSTSYYPVIEFDDHGHIETQMSHIGSNPCKYKVGEELKIAYDQKCPRHFLIIGDQTAWHIAKIFKWVGILLLVIGCISLVIAFRVR